MKLIKGPEIERAKWTALLSANSNASAFQTPYFYDLITSVQDSEAEVYAVEEESAILALCVVTLLKEKGLKGYFSRRAIIYGGPVWAGQNSEVAEFLLNSIKNELKGRIIYIEIRNISDTSSLKSSFNKCRFRYSDHLDIIIDLKKSEESLWEEVHKNRKKEIKKGINKGLSVQLISLTNTEYLSEIYEMLSQLYKKIGLPLPPITYFRQAVQILEPIKVMQTFCAFVDNKLVGFRMVLTYNKMIYDWYASSKNEYLSYRPNDILPWEIMKWGKINNFDIFDFGGGGSPDKDYGVRDYKVKFGGTVVNHGRYMLIASPFLFLLSSTAFRIWQKIK